MNGFWSRNWDKIGTLLLGGVVGFFSGIIATNQAISGLSDRVTKLETNAISLYKPAAIKVDEVKLRQIGLINDVSGLRNQQVLTDKLVELQLKTLSLSA